MSKNISRERILHDFAKPSYNDWKAAAVDSLKGADFDKKLLTQTYDGITVRPIYTVDDLPAGFNGLPGAGAFRRGARAEGNLKYGWGAVGELPYGDAETFAKALDAEFARGAINTLLIQTDVATQKGIDPDEAGPGEVGACGLSIATSGDIQKALGKAIWSALPTYWQTGGSGLAILALWVAHLKSKGEKLKEIVGGIDGDPFALALHTGEIDKGFDSALDELASTIAWGRKNMPRVTMLGLDGGIYAHAGAAAVQQLGYLAAATVEYIRELSKRGVKPKEVFASLHWNLQVGPEFFMELAKLRASRVVWSNLVAAYGLKPKDFPPRIAARTGFIDKTIFDAHNNILRNSTEAFAAILGGAEAINIGAFDEVYRTPDAFSRRIAENVHLILREEMGLDRLIDPAGGAYAIESLTAELANKSWEKLQCIEKAGGFRKAITEGELQKSVAEVSAERAKRFSARRSVLIGTNRYAVAKEEIPSALTQDWESLHKSRAEEIAQLHKSQTRECASSLEGLTKTASDNRSSGKVVDSAIKAAAEGATLGEITKALREDTLTGKVQITPLRCGRLALPYERVRGLARKFGAKVTLICFGKLGQYKVRADWIREFCEAGGIEVDAAVIDSSDKVGAMLSEHPARATVICCDDETYPAIVPALAQAVKATQAAPQLYLAGAIPSELEAQWKSARLDGSISVKSNHLQTVEEIINLYK